MYLISRSFGNKIDGVLCHKSKTNLNNTTLQHILVTKKCIPLINRHLSYSTFKCNLVVINTP